MNRSQLLRCASAALVLAGAACSSGDATLPERLMLPASRSVQPAAQAADAASPPPHLARCAPHAPVVSRGVFGPAGGRLEVGGSILIIPGGALRDTVTITGTSLGDSTTTVQFQPHGLQFLRPVELVLNGRACEFPPVGRPSIVYLGDHGEVLETIPAEYLPRWKLVGAPIHHFSGYAVLF